MDFGSVIDLFNRLIKKFTEMASVANDFLDLCRICAKKSKAMLALFEIRKEKISLVEMISHCTQLKFTPNDNRPQNVCRKCIKNLNISYEFSQLAKESEENFRQMVLSQESTLKEESEQSNHITFKVTCELKYESSDDVDTFDDDIGYEESTTIVKEPEESKEIVPIEKATICENRPEIQPKTNDTKPDKKTKRQPAKKVAKKKKKKNEEKNRTKEMDGSWYVMRSGKDCWECFKCRTKFNALSKLRLHIKEHIAATPNECTVCELYYSNKEFKRHLCIGKSIQCEYCSEEITSIEQLTRHLESDHKNQVIVTKCTEFRCKKRFPMKLLLEWHLQLHNRRFMSFVCAICKAGFSIKFSYIAHLKTHSNEKRKFIKFFFVFCKS